MGSWSTAIPGKRGQHAPGAGVVVRVVAHVIEDGVVAPRLPESREGAVAAHREARRERGVDLHPLVDERLDLEVPGERRQQLGAVVRDPRTLRGQGAEVGDAHGAAPQGTTCRRAR